MTPEETAWQIVYRGSREVFKRGVWVGRFRLVRDDEQEQKVKVELSEELVANIKSKWPEIDADPDSLIRRLGKKAILAQLRQKGEADKVICLYKKHYPGYPGPPDMGNNFAG